LADEQPLTFPRRRRGGVLRRLRSESEQEMSALRIFHDVARAITSSLDLKSILRSILDQMAQFFQPETWALLMIDEQRGELYYSIAAGKFSQYLRDVRMPMSQGIAGRVAMTSESVVVENVASDPSVAGTFTMLTRHGLAEPTAVICIPVVSQGKTVAVIQLLDPPLDEMDRNAIYFVHVLADYTSIAIQNAHAVERIRELTITDDCTGLFNVRHLYDRLQSEVERAKRSQSPFSLVFIDLDHFKRVNDTHGHLVGSQLLAEVGEVLKSCLREVDSAYRYGGDEFVALLPDTSKADAVEVARRARAKLRSTIFPGGAKLDLRVRASFGLSTFPDDGDSIASVIRAADDMMYLVKQSSRDNIAVAQIGLIGADESSRTELIASISPKPLEA
jgi:diguanylate cyclase (GGDEF)-like protein